MIEGPERPAEPAVAAHYDALDRYYRAIWGEHVHHGLWWTGRESPQEATRALIDLVARRAGLKSGMAVCDVGCGYGGTARVLAGEHAVEVTGLTISRAQYEHARAGGASEAEAPAPPRRPPRYLLRSWLDNGLAPESFDAVIAIESLSHMGDLARALAECARVLRPGGRLVVCDWLAGEAPRRWQRRLLLEPICREGRLARIASASEHQALIGAAGLAVEGFDDLSGHVRRTWTICLRRTAAVLWRDREARSFLLSSRNPDRAFGLAMLRIPLAYRTSAMRLGVLSAVKPPRSRAPGGSERGAVPR